MSDIGGDGGSGSSSNAQATMNILRGARYNDPRLVKKGIEAGGSVLTKEYGGYTALGHACHNASVEIMEMICLELKRLGTHWPETLDLGSQAKGYSPLMLVASTERADLTVADAIACIKILLDYELVDVDADSCPTVLMFACLQDEPLFDVIKVLVQYGADIMKDEMADYMREEMVLRILFSNEMTEQMERLESLDPDSAGRDEQVDRLYDQLKARHEDEMLAHTPLSMIMSKGMVGTAIMMLDEYMKRRRGQQPDPEKLEFAFKMGFQWAMRNPSDPHINAKMIRSCQVFNGLGVTVAQKVCGNYTPLAIACMVGARNLITVLAGIYNVPIGSPASAAPIHVACRYSTVMVVDLLLSLGGSLHMIDDDGNTALYHAMTGNNVAVVEYLLRNGVVNSKVDGNGTLKRAAYYCCLDVLIILMRATGRRYLYDPEYPDKLKSKRLVALLRESCRSACDAASKIEYLMHEDPLAGLPGLDRHTSIRSSTLVQLLEACVEGGNLDVMQRIVRYIPLDMIIPPEGGYYTTNPVLDYFCFHGRSMNVELLQYILKLSQIYGYIPKAAPEYLPAGIQHPVDVLIRRPELNILADDPQATADCIHLVQTNYCRGWMPENNVYHVLLERHIPEAVLLLKAKGLYREMLVIPAHGSEERQLAAGLVEAITKHDVLSVRAYISLGVFHYNHWNLASNRVLPSGLACRSIMAIAVESYHPEIFRLLVNQPRNLDDSVRDSSNLAEFPIYGLCPLYARWLVNRNAHTRAILEAACQHLLEYGARFPPYHHTNADLRRIEPPREMDASEFRNSDILLLVEQRREHERYEREVQEARAAADEHNNLSAQKNLKTMIYKICTWIARRVELHLGSVIQVIYKCYNPLTRRIEVTAFLREELVTTLSDLWELFNIPVAEPDVFPFNEAYVADLINLIEEMVVTSTDLMITKSVVIGGVIIPLTNRFVRDGLHHHYPVLSTALQSARASLVDQELMQQVAEEGNVRDFFKLDPELRISNVASEIYKNHFGQIQRDLLLLHRDARQHLEDELVEGMVTMHLDMAARSQSRFNAEWRRIEAKKSDSPRERDLRSMYNASVGKKRPRPAELNEESPRKKFSRIQRSYAMYIPNPARLGEPPTLTPPHEPAPGERRIPPARALNFGEDPDNEPDAHLVGGGEEEEGNTDELMNMSVGSNTDFDDSGYGGLEGYLGRPDLTALQEREEDTFYVQGILVTPPNRDSPLTTTTPATERRPPIDRRRPPS